MRTKKFLAEPGILLNCVPHPHPQGHSLYCRSGFASPPQPTPRLTTFLGRACACLRGTAGVLIYNVRHSAEILLRDTPGVLLGDTPCPEATWGNNGQVSICSSGKVCCSQTFQSLCCSWTFQSLCFPPQSFRSICPLHLLFLHLSMVSFLGCDRRTNTEQ